ncbi:TonB-dependent receptor [Acetobacter orientalis]|uniref:TonB-dependent receptor n=1 Tax=Acetobacter orientalis TaxID=146474 RepID=A0A2Z5ZG96_9PROT|nr:TonB-dependent receptor [Acetobacter orientalis]
MPVTVRHGAIMANAATHKAPFLSLGKSLALTTNTKKRRPIMWPPFLVQ